MEYTRVLHLNSFSHLPLRSTAATTTDWGRRWIDTKLTVQGPVSRRENELKIVDSTESRL